MTIGSGKTLRVDVDQPSASPVPGDVGSRDRRHATDLQLFRVRKVLAHLVDERVSGRVPENQPGVQTLRETPAVSDPT